MHRSKRHRYSITSSAINCIELGTAMPRAAAVPTLMTNSNFVRLLHGQVAGLLTLENPPGIDAHTAIRIRLAGSTSTVVKVTPVTFPPDRLRLATRPVLTGAVPTTKMIGMVADAACTALLWPTRTATRRLTK